MGISFRLFFVDDDRDEVEKMQEEEEEKILLSVTQNSALLSVAELAKGVKYLESIQTRYFSKFLFFNNHF